MEVIHALAELQEMSMDEIETMRLEKNKARGGFKRRIYLKWVEPGGE